MDSEALCLDVRVPIAVLAPWRAVNGALLELLRGFSDEDWRRPTVHRDRDVKDLTAHLLHGSLRRVSAMRDRYSATMVPIHGLRDLIAFVQEDNRLFMNGMKRMAPALLIELLARYDPIMLTLFEEVDPEAPGLGVAWAGEWDSKQWFDTAREYTEKWHHQQQLRDATGRAPLYDFELFAPVLETFARGLPFAYRELESPEGTALAIRTTGAAQLGWTLRRQNRAWTLWRGADSAAANSLSLPSEMAWRLWTKGLDRETARAQIQMQGDNEFIEPILNFVAILA